MTDLAQEPLPQQYGDHYERFRRLYDPSDLSERLAYDIHFKSREGLESVTGSMNLPLIRADLHSLGHNLGVVAHGLGCEIVQPYKGRSTSNLYNPWTKPMALSDAAKLSVPEDIGAAFDHFISKYETWRRDGIFRHALPMLPTVESPLDTLAHIYNPTEAMLLLSTNPKRVCEVMDIAVETAITFINHMKNEFPEAVHTAYYASWFPRERGVSVGEDNMTLISPDMYAAYVLPRIERIGQEYGGYFLHACGDITPYLDMLLGSEWIRGLHFMPWTSPVEEVIQKASGVIPLVVRIGDIDYWADGETTPMIHQLKRIINARQPDTSIYIHGTLGNTVLDVFPEEGSPEFWKIVTDKKEVEALLAENGLLTPEF